MTRADRCRLRTALAASARALASCSAICSRRSASVRLASRLRSAMTDSSVSIWTSISACCSVLLTRTDTIGAMASSRSNRSPSAIWTSVDFTLVRCAHGNKDAYLCASVHPDLGRYVARVGRSIRERVRLRCLCPVHDRRR